jgi:hypothetical protein
MRILSSPIFLARNFCCNDDSRTLTEAMYHANDRDILPLMLDMRLYVNPKDTPSLAIASLST